MIRVTFTLPCAPCARCAPRVPPRPATPRPAERGVVFVKSFGGGGGRPGGARRVVGVDDGPRAEGPVEGAAVPDHRRPHRLHQRRPGLRRLRALRGPRRRERVVLLDRDLGP